VDEVVKGKPWQGGLQGVNFSGADIKGDGP